MNKTNQILIQEVIDKIIKESPALGSHSHFSWVLIGGYATNSQNPNSDIDLLYFYEGGEEFYRFKKPINNIKVSLCGVPLSMLIQDGRNRKFGGYFSAKCLNPHYIFSQDEIVLDAILLAAGEFMGPLASYPASLTGKKEFTAEELAAHMIIVFSSMRSGYFSYFLSYYVLNNFPEVWKQMINNTKEAFLASGAIKDVGHQQYSYAPDISIKTYPEYHFQRLEADSRHWSFAAYAHDGDYSFQDKFYENAQRKVRKLDPLGINARKAEAFLINITGLDSIYV